LRYFIKINLYLFIALLFFSKESFSTESNIIQSLVGDITVNKTKAFQGEKIKSGDEISTAKNSRVVILYADEVYQLRENTTFILPSEVKKESVSNLVTGSVLAAFVPGRTRQMKISNTTISIRGTGIYARLDSSGVHYCLCYGKSELNSHDHTVTLDTTSKFHKDLIVLNDGTIRTPRLFGERKFDHTSQENIQLEKLLGRPTPFGGGYRDLIAIFENKKL